MNLRRHSGKSFLAAVFLILGCNGGDGTYTDGPNRAITVESIKEKLAESKSLDNSEKRFIAFHVQEFNVADWAKILSKAEADVRGTDVSQFSSSYWTENNLSRAEFQAVLAESDGCSVTLLKGSGQDFTYRLPGCTDFNNTGNPDIVIPDVTYALYFYNQIDVPDDWAPLSDIAISLQTTQLTKLFSLNDNTVYFRNDRLQRGFELKVHVEKEGPTNYDPGTVFMLKSPSPVVLEKVSEGSYIAHYLDDDFISRIQYFGEKKKQFINVNVIRVPRIVSVLTTDDSDPQNVKRSWGKPTHIAYQNANDDRVKQYENTAGYTLSRSVSGQYVIFMGLEPAKERAINNGCRNQSECQTMASYVLDHLVAHENGHLLMTVNHSRDPGHLMYPSIPPTLPVGNLGPPFTDDKGQRVDRLNLTTAGWTF